MSSGFVSGGTTDNPIERDEEWLTAQREIEANRRRKEEEGRQEGGKSLYEVLQGNKAAKQEAFEESIRLKNQFRTLDEDEIEFLDSVLESTRTKEDAIKKETTEQLETFRRQQEEADRESLGYTAQANPVGEPGSPVNQPSTDSSWAINARKRKRNKDTGLSSTIKFRKSSSTSDHLPAVYSPAVSPKVATRSPYNDVPEVHSPMQATRGSGNKSPPFNEKPPQRPPGNLSPTTVKVNTSALGLAAYSSDEED
ncbi:MAG: hypothetical protein Q9219_004400 [cf. Caloplaca sp. 3 TL-2023]